MPVLVYLPPAFSDGAKKLLYGLYGLYGLDAIVPWDAYNFIFLSDRPRHTHVPTVSTCLSCGPSSGIGLLIGGVSLARFSFCFLYFVLPILNFPFFF